MKINDFINVMERLAPSCTALSFDNCGLIIGTEREEIKRVLAALDCTNAVADEAAKVNADLVLTHHPLLFNGVKRILPGDPICGPVYKLIRCGIALFSAHTNLDAAEGGVNTALCRTLGIENELPAGDEGIMRVGELPNEIMLDEFVRHAQRKIGTTLMVSGSNRPIKRVAVMGGSGGGDYALAKASGADVYLTGECKHNQAIEAAALGLAVVTAGHYQTEVVVLKPLIEYLQIHTCGVEYLLSEACTPVFRVVQTLQNAEKEGIK